MDIVSPTITNLIILLPRFMQGRDQNWTLFVTDTVILAIAAFLLAVGIRTAIRYVREARLASQARPAPRTVERA